MPRVLRCPYPRAVYHLMIRVGPSKFEFRSLIDIMLASCHIHFATALFCANQATDKSSKEVLAWWWLKWKLRVGMIPRAADTRSVVVQAFLPEFF